MVQMGRATHVEAAISSQVSCLRFYLQSTLRLNLLSQRLMNYVWAMKLTLNFLNYYFADHVQSASLLDNASPDGRDPRGCKPATDSLDS